MAVKTIYESPVGLGIFQYDWDGDNITITGYPSKKNTDKSFDGAYEFQDYIQKKIDCNGIEFDSEYSQFFAYAKTEDRAKKFIQDIEDWFKHIN